MAKASKKAPTPAPAPLGKTTVTVDRAEFIRTRDALTSAYMNLSASMDRMVKAYLEHTQTVLEGGDESLNVSFLLGPLANAASNVQALLANGTGAATELQAAGGAAAAEEDGDDEKPKKERKEKKPKDPNAPKRPLTAYFRYLQEQRAPIAKEIEANPKKFEIEGKAGDISKIASNRWNLMSAEDHEPYHLAYREGMHAFEKAMEAYKATQTAAGEEGEPVVPAGKTTRQPEDVSTDSDDSSDDSADSDDDEKEEEQPAPPPPTSAKKASAKKANAAKTNSTAAAPAKPVFSSLQTETPSAAKPGRKRKAPAAAAAATTDAAPAAAPAADAEEPAKKKRNVRKPKSDAAIVPDTPAKAVELPATTTPAADKSAKKKKEKEKKEKRKSVGAA